MVMTVLPSCSCRSVLSGGSAGYSLIAGGPRGDFHYNPHCSVEEGKFKFSPDTPLASSGHGPAESIFDVQVDTQTLHHPVQMI